MTDTTVADVLRAARAKIEKPECWTQRADARDAFGKTVEAHSMQAVCWCSIGAIRAVTETIWPYWDATQAFGRAIGEIAPSDFNDTHTHAEVLDAFSKAIAAAEVSP